MPLNSFEQAALERRRNNPSEMQNHLFTRVQMYSTREERNRVAVKQLQLASTNPTLSGVLFEPGSSMLTKAAASTLLPVIDIDRKEEYKWRFTDNDRTQLGAALHAEMIAYTRAGKTMTAQELQRVEADFAEAVDMRYRAHMARMAKHDTQLQQQRSQLHQLKQQREDARKFSERKAYGFSDSPGLVERGIAKAKADLIVLNQKIEAAEKTLRFEETSPMAIERVALCSADIPPAGYRMPRPKGETSQLLQNRLAPELVKQNANLTVRDSKDHAPLAGTQVVMSGLGVRQDGEAAGKANKITSVDQLRSVVNAAVKTAVAQHGKR